MAIELEDGTLGFCPEEWVIERHHMILAAFDDLNCAITCVTLEGKPFIPNAKYIADAFGLLATGLDCPVEDLAENQGEFTRALGNDAENRVVLMRAAMDNLVDTLGFKPKPPRILGTFELRGEPWSSEA